MIHSAPDAPRIQDMGVRILPDARAVSLAAASVIEAAIREAIAARGHAVLGLATGSTPEGAYARLVERHASGDLSFREVTTYNLDEYYPISPADPRSYRAYMHRHLFGRVDIAPNRAHLLDGSVPESAVAEHCAAFEGWIESDGGLDFQLLGIGRNGHIGFNEPCGLRVDEATRLRTRLVDLHPLTRADAVREFGSAEAVIPTALTLGVATILAARSILILATGAHKAEAVAAALTGPMTAEVPASLLQSVAPRVTWILDRAAAGALATPPAAGPAIG
ncbi:MAG: glucosamine-6-phosphate deaminase [Isosphaeraceae bacterium]